MSVRVFAPAKINLTLQVGAPRADGMHPLQSMVVFADVGDVVEAAPASNLSLSIDGPFAQELSSDADNLVLRAARALAEAAGVPAQAHLKLDKQLPIASGVGGGSSDAAAALRALSSLWRLDWDNAQLAALGARLGSDVPVFFYDSAAVYMQGLGEICTPTETPVFPALLVNPLEPLATPAVYRQFDAMGLGRELHDASPPRWADEAQALHHISVIGNDLEAPAVALAPIVAEVLTILRAEKSVLYAGLSGSGATCFALFSDVSAARAMGAELKARHQSWWVCDTRLGGA